MRKLYAFLVLCLVSWSSFAQNDLSVTAITAPVSGCALTATENVTIRLFNFGANLPAGTTFNVTYTINAGGPVTELVTLGSPLLTNSNFNYTFTTQANLSVPGTYTFDATVSIGGDINPTNNAFTGYSVTNTAPSNGGTITGPASVCISGNSGVLTLSGHVGNVVRWEYSIDGGSTWINLSNTTTTQAYNNLTDPTLYRAVVQNGGCAPATSAIHSIAIDPVSVGGTVSGSATRCSGSNSGTLTNSGRTGTIIRWEFSTDGGVTWNNIANTSATQSYLNLTQTTQYRVRVQSGTCSAVYSSIATITISPNTVGGSISPATSTVCAGSNSGTLTLSGHVGGVVRWEFSIDGGVTWTNIANTSTSQNYTNLTTTRLYRARIQSGACGALYSTIATINVDPATVAGNVTPASITECASGNAGTLTLTGAAGTVQFWEFSIDGGVTWTNIANTTTTENYSNLTTTTLYRAFVQNGGCTPSYSGISTVSVSPESDGGTVSGGSPVCSGTNSGTLTLSGQVGTITNWEFSNDGVTWNNIANTTTSQNFANLTDTTYYRAIVTSGVCPADTSTIDTVIVYPPSDGGTVLPASTTVCSGLNAGTLTLNANVGDVLRWEYSTDGGVTWITISNTTTSQSYNNLTTATIYRAFVQSGTCSPVYSAQAAVLVTPQPVGGTLYADATVCGGSNSGTLTLVGFSGAITNWESSIDGGVTWTPIANTTINENYSNLVDTTMYRVIVGTVGCPADTSTIATIFVDAPSVGGSITNSDTVCAGANSGTMTLSGMQGVVEGWEYSVDGGVTWINISNTSTTQGYLNLMTTTQYRARVKNGVCNPAFSDTVTITVDPMVMGGSVAGGTTVCASGNSGTLTLSGYSGTIVSWETSTDGGITWTANGNTTATESYTNLTDTTWYQVIVQSGVCGTDTSLVGTIIVDPITVAGVLTDNDTVCAGSNGDTLRLNGYTGNIIRWEMSTDGNNWISLTNTTDSLVYTNLTQTTYYRVLVQSGVCAPALYSNIDTITVSPFTVSGALSGNAAVCEGTGNGTITLSGQTGAVVDWIVSTDNGVTWTPVGNTTTSQTWSNPTDTTWYQAIVQSGGCLADTTSSAIITVYPKPVAAFTSTPVCEGGVTTFVNSTTVASGGILFQNWDFGDNNASVAASPSHTYGASGNFNVTLIVVSNNNCSDTATGVAIVNANPSADITSSLNTTLCSGDSTLLSVPTSINASYSWNTGDTTASIYADVTGTYVVVATDTVTGCTSSDSVSITVLPRPSAFAGPDTAVSAGGSIVMLGSGGVFYNWVPTVGLSDPTVANPTCTPPYNVTYTLTVTDMNGCSDNDTVAVTLKQDYNVVISNLITANGDGFNDTWFIENINFYPQNKVVIYNRNGMEVFQMEGYNNSWNGTYNGSQLPDGTYYYVLEFTDTGEVLKGAVTVISEKK